MSTLNPFGWLLLVGLPILYLLSKNNRQVMQINVPSLALWKTLYQEYQPKRRLKHGRTLLLALQFLAVLCGVFGVLDLYRTDILGDHMVILYDRSIASAKTEKKVLLTNFLKAHKNSTYELVFVDNRIETIEHIMTSREAKESLLSVRPSYRPLDIGLLKTTYTAYKNKGIPIIVVSNQATHVNDIEDDLMGLPVNHNNIGIRYATYNPKEAAVYIELENDYHTGKGTTLELLNQEKVLYNNRFYLKPAARQIFKVPIANFKEKLYANEGLLTVRLTDLDSLIEDNTYTFPYVLSLGIQFKNNGTELDRIVDLMSYIHKDSSGLLIDTFRLEVGSDVQYGDAFIEAVKNNGIADEGVKRSPYFPLWIEDHLINRYTSYIENLNRLYPLENPPRYYRRHVNAMDAMPTTSLAKTGLPKTMGQVLPKEIWLMCFLICLILEEEVRRRV